MKIIAKRFSSSSVRVLLEKVIGKFYKMFQHKTSMRKPFFLYALQLENNFSIYLFLENFEKCPEKKTQKLSEKRLTGLVSMNIFTDTLKKS